MSLTCRYEPKRTRWTNGAPLPKVGVAGSNPVVRSKPLHHYMTEPARP
jgi:hypothetical protein